MKSVFLAGPFKGGLSVESGLLEEPLKRQLMDLVDFLENRGFRVFNAHRREQWGRDLVTPEECTSIDFEEIKESDWVVALPGCPASPGTHIELGWASALGKPITVLLEAGKEYAFLVRGLHRVTDVRYIHFESTEDCLSELSKICPDPL